MQVNKHGYAPIKLRHWNLNVMIFMWHKILLFWFFPQLFKKVKIILSLWVMWKQDVGWNWLMGWIIRISWCGGSKQSCGHESPHFTCASTASRLTAMNPKRESQRHQSDNSRSSIYVHELRKAYECWYLHIYTYRYISI